jgi:hypothetical protein
MVDNKMLHTNALDMVLEPLSEFSSLEEPPLKNIFDPLKPLYRGFKQERAYPLTRLLITELFELLANYVDETERLLIKEVDMHSPGGMTFRSRVKRFPDSGASDTKRQISPLSKTRKFIEDIFSKRKNIQTQMMQDNRQVDPRLLDLTNQILFDGPVRVIDNLAKQGKIRMPEYQDDRWGRE